MPYCKKCKTVTDLDGYMSNTENNRQLFIGQCAKCGIKRNVFLNKDGNFKSIYDLTDKEQEKVMEKRRIASNKRKALKIGLKVLENDALNCVKKCINKDSKNELVALTNIHPNIYPNKVPFGAIPKKFLANTPLGLPSGTEFSYLKISSFFVKT